MKKTTNTIGSKSASMIQAVTYRLVAQDDIPDALEVPSMDLPCGGPTHGLWALVSGTANTLQVTASASLQARKHGLTVLYFQMACRAGIWDPALMHDARWEEISYLPLHRLSRKYDALLKAWLLPRDTGNLLANTGSTSVQEIFLDNALSFGDFLFSALPNLNILTWDISDQSGRSHRLRALCIRTPDVVTHIQVLGGSSFSMEGRTIRFAAHAFEHEAIPDPNAKPLFLS